MSTLDDKQKKFLRIYDNLRYDAAHFVASASEPQNLARQLFDGFMQNDTFTESMRATAVDLGRIDVLADIDNYEPKINGRNGMADDLVAMVDRGEDIGGLTEVSAPPSYSMDQLSTFWNIAANIQQGDPELYTHLVADKRYMAIFDQTVSANEYTEDSVAKLRGETLDAHQTAAQTVSFMKNDRFSSLNKGSSDQIYDLLAESDFEQLGKGMTSQAPQTIFSGLKVVQPLSADRLAMPSVAYEKIYEGSYGSLQSEKNIQAEFPDLPQLTGEMNFPEPDITLPDMPVLAGELNIDTASITGSTALAKLFNLKAVAETGTAPAAEAQVTAAIEEDNKYAVKAGDNLWKIAKNEYGLTNYKDIMRAVDHIARENGLEKDADANHIKPGMELSIPSKDAIAMPVEKLDWAALDADRMANTRQMAFN